MTRPSARGGDEEHLDRMRAAFEHSALAVEQLWLRYFGLGGAAGPAEVDAYLNGAMSLPPLERDMVAHAINERLDEVCPRAPYTHRDPPGTGPPGGALDEPTLDDPTDELGRAP